MIKQDILENQAKVVYLSIGSNLGNKRNNIEIAKIKLQTSKIKIIESSNNYETISWPDKNNPKFINIILKVTTSLSIIKLMKKCLKIEKELGRVRKRKNEPRIIDIDIIDYDQQSIINKTELDISVPHPEMHKRGFVLLPLFELNKTWTHPVLKRNIIYLINSFDIKDFRSIKII